MTRGSDQCYFWSGLVVGGVNGGSVLTGPVRVSHFLTAELLENMGEPFRVPKNACVFPYVTKIKPLRGVLFVCASGGTRTHTVLLPRDFKSLVSTIPPPRHMYTGRRRPESNRRISVLQTAALGHFATAPLGQYSTDAI